MSTSCDVAYVVQAQDGSVVKVGVSGNPRKRVYQITQTMPFPMRLVALLAGGKVVERQMKDLLAPWKLRGEWFHPRPELNDFLAAQRGQNKILQAMPVNDEFCDAFIRPAVLEYLAGRQPTLTDAGDIVFRFLQEGSKSVAGRMDRLYAAVKKQVQPEVFAGFIPIAAEAETPAVVIPLTSLSAATDRAA